ncbi:MAG: septum formation protein Maf [Paludibacteraceae bacterium]|nr:septum formation protein Maf [Paludibacteraceae bacterium]
MSDTLSSYRLLLGSKSPRRRELLKALDVEFSIVDISCNETYPPAFQGGDIPIYIAREKADAYRAMLKPDELLITADTIVWLDGAVLGKPHDEEDACRMLRLLSGKTHQVYTGVCLTTNQRQKAFADCTDVSFRELTDEEIRYYVNNYRPFDKAGAYGIQEWIGMAACTGINGSYFNVMGLPVHRVADELKGIAL